jgi:hypothetical protein
VSGCAVRSTHAQLWLAVSWGIGNPLMGLTAEYNFDYNFYAFGALNALSIVIVAVALPARTRAERAHLVQALHTQGDACRPVQQTSDGACTPTDGTRHAQTSSARVLCTPRYVAFLAWCAFFGTSQSLVDNFLFVFLTNQLHARSTLCGISVAVQVLRAAHPTSLPHLTSPSLLT